MDSEIFNKINKKIPKNVIKILHKLDKAGYEAYIIGGCIRDLFLNKIPNNWNIATNATPDDIIAVFIHYCTVLSIAKKYGTVMVIIKGEKYEITTYRTDGKYIDNRHPTNTTFTHDLIEDLSHRDFVMNAMAYNPDTDIGLIDPYGGITAITSKVVHCVGNPNNRFAEDGLRILRTLRFASQLNFVIEAGTSEALHNKKYLIKNVSKERINREMQKFIQTDNNSFIALLYNYADVFGEISDRIGIKNFNQFLSLRQSDIPDYNFDYDIIYNSVIKMTGGNKNEDNQTELQY